MDRSIRNRGGLVLIVLFAAVVLAFAPMAPLANAQDDAASDELLVQGVDSEGMANILVSLDPGENADDSLAEMEVALAESDISVVGASEVYAAEDGEAPLYSVRVRSGDPDADPSDVSKEASAAAAQADAVKTAGPNKRFRALSVDPMAAYQYEHNGRWDADGIGVGSNNVRTLASSTGNSATIAVIDSGFRASHVELKGKLLTNLAYNGVTGEEGPAAIGTDSHDHGTGVASVLVGNRKNGYGGYGMCVNTKVIPMTAADGEGYFDESYVIACIKQIERLVAAGQVTDLHVVVMSFGAWYSEAQREAWNMGVAGKDLLYDAIRGLYSKYGILCVCAGGNGSGNKRHVTGYNYPSDYPQCVAVTASDDKGRNCVFSDANAQKDLTAPGENIVVASSQSDTAIDTGGEGTSFAAPIVAGAISTLIQIDPSLTPAAALKLLKKTATPVPNSSAYRYAAVNTNNKGIINLAKAAFQASGEDAYWKGMNDIGSVAGVKYGFRVLTDAEAATHKAALTARPEAMSNKVEPFTFPCKVKLSDGVKYQVTAFPDRVLKKVTFTKTKYLTKKSLKNCFKGAKQVKKVVIKVSKNHKVNVKWMKKVKKYLKKSVVGAKVVKVVAA